MYFSERNKIVVKDEIIFGNIKSSCRNRILNWIHNLLLRNSSNEKERILMYLLDKTGKICPRRNGDYLDFFSESYVNELLNTFDNSWIKKFQWYECFDLIEMLLDFDFNELKSADIKNEINLLNKVLEEEKSGYRILDNLIVPVTSNDELNQIEESLNTPFENVNLSLEKALKLYSDRKTPDYQNSIKESITAVESMCCIICHDDSVTLGQALSKLESQGIYIHGAMKAGFNALYGYTSDETGIRHGGINNSKVSAEDAKYMLISCAAFINYLKEKYVKAGENKNEQNRQN